MSEAREEQDRIFRQHGAVLVRQRKHEVWRFPDGRTFTRAKTPSDVRSDKNALMDLKLLLGINKDRGAPGKRRNKKARKRAHKVVRASLSKYPPVKDSGVYAQLMAIVRRPKYSDCFAMEKRVVLKTPVMVWLERWFK